MWLERSESKESDHVGDLVAGRHALAEGNAGLDLRPVGGGVGLGRKPGGIHGRPAFGDDHAFTRIPAGASSTAHSRVRALRPPLAAA